MRSAPVRLVGAHEGEVEGVARVDEIVGVAAEEAGLQLGREYQLHGLVAMVGVQLVLAALEEGDHLADGARLGLAGSIALLRRRLRRLGDLGIACRAAQRRPDRAP